MKKFGCFIGICLKCGSNSEFNYIRFDEKIKEFTLYITCIKCGKSRVIKKSELIDCMNNEYQYLYAQAQNRKRKWL